MIYSDTLMETEAQGKRETVSKLQSGVQSGFEPTSAPESVLLCMTQICALLPLQGSQYRIPQSLCMSKSCKNELRQ